MLVDTHCHIHESNYPLDVADVLQRARRAGVEEYICVGTNEISSEEAIVFAAEHEGAYASIGVHPHDAKDGWRNIMPLAETAVLRQVQQPSDISALATSANESKLVAIGEIGLDYFYTHSPRDTQITALEEQLAVALKHNLPVIFHVREAFDDFWPIFDNFRGIRGELHSFTGSIKDLEEGLKRGLYFGVNGISTFTKQEEQKKMFATIPLERMLLETDAPFLTPMPFRGKVNEPAFVRNVAEYHASIRGILLEEVADTTTKNAKTLFNLL